MHQPQKHNRRKFLKRSGVVPPGLALAFGAISPWTALEVDAEGSESADMAAARKMAQQRRRRLIYNDDGCGPLGSPIGNMVDGFLYGQ